MTSTCIWHRFGPSGATATNHRDKVASAATSLGWASSSRADSLDVTLIEADQTVVQGTTVVEFDASISNPSTTDTIYLNSDTSTTDSLLVSVDDNPFNVNAPFFLIRELQVDLSPYSMSICQWIWPMGFTPVSSPFWAALAEAEMPMILRTQTSPWT
jgi:hypothetical protein